MRLARISHRPSTTHADLLAVTGRTPCSRLDVVSATPSPSSGPCPPTQRHLCALATNGGELCGLAGRGSSVDRRTSSRAGSLLYLLLLFLLLPAVPPAAGATADTPTPVVEVRTFDDPEDQRRYVGLLRQLRCMVCQNESLAESNAGLARDLRRSVHSQIEAGRGDQEILRFMTDRYGEFILYRPPVRPATYLLWFGPIALLVMGSATLFWMMRRRPTTSAGTVLSEHQRQRAARLLDGVDHTRGGGR